MASPPYRSPAASPPHPAHTTIPNPRKRPQLVMPNHANTLKRRKVSSFSTSTTTSAHPLRQTSFPPEESAFSRDERSPSVDSDYTAITGKQSVGTSAFGGKKARGKKKKVDGSVKSETAKGTADGRSVAEGVDEYEDGEEVDGDADGEDGVVEDGAKVDRAAEKKKMAVLIDAFNEDQTERYNMYRRVKLKKETVRRITNQTLSQSVPPSVITTINGFTKVFIGTIIERAREVQKQYAEAESSLPSPSRSNQEPVAGLIRLDADVKSPKAEELGPLLPDHLREALRRYKKDGEGGGAGVEGTSLGLGLSGAGSMRLGGRRLFR
ncbi:hypothetical protein MMC34_002215 [Xylographa carneopallida]|nr:hypothetical protein [Xylographa carneopallida]